MKAQEVKITVNVDVAFEVSNEVADKCLRILEFWQNSHATQEIARKTCEDGTVRFYRKERENERSEN